MNPTPARPPLPSREERRRQLFAPICRGILAQHRICGAMLSAGNSWDGPYLMLGRFRDGKWRMPARRSE